MCTCREVNPHRRRFLLALAAGAAWAPFRSATAMQGPGGGSLHRSKGGVLINEKPAEAGSVVVAGDTVTTGQDGEAVFTLGDDAFLLRSASKVTIRDSVGTSRPQRELSLESGRVLSVFGPKQITLKTPQLNVGIRGTAAYLEAEPGATNVCVCYGHAVMAPQGVPEQSEEVHTHHHDAPRRIVAGRAGLVMQPFMVVNHADEELVMLEALLGRVPPFVRK
ncbi:MAG: FecR domain-containing protein [Magnetospirillum sp.]|nr:FecR domain-containing protein [Magnetospirillum sp.]